MPLMEQKHFDTFRKLFVQGLEKYDFKTVESIIKALKTITLSNQTETASKSQQTLRNISNKISIVLIELRKELSGEQYQMLLKLYQESSEIIMIPLSEEKNEEFKKRKYLRTGEVAEKLGVTSETVRNMLEDERLYGEKNGKHWRIPSEQFDKLDKPQMVAEKLHNKYNVKENEQKNIINLFGVLGDGEQTNDDFETIREHAKKKHYEWLKGEGKY
jgi:excisionase family DNA binding protein